MGPKNLVAALGLAILCSGCNWDKIIETEVTVHVLNGDGTPGENAIVVFHGPDGEVVAETESDEQGIARHHLDAGGMVTVAFDYVAGKQLETWMGVGLTDHLYFLSEFGPPVVEIDVTLPGAFLDADRYRVSAGCASAETTNNPPGVLTLEVNQECLTTPLTVTAAAFGAPGPDRPVAFAVVNDAGNPAAGSLDVVMDTWRTDFEPFMLQLDGIPADGLYLAAEIMPVVDKASLLPWWWDYLELAGETSATIPLQRIPGLGSSDHLRADVFWEDDSRTSILTVVAGHPAAHAIDLAQAFPRITSVGLSSAQPERPVVTWTTGDVSSADLFTMTVSSDQKSWWVRGPPETIAPLRLPALPESVEDWLPPASGNTVYVAYRDNSEQLDAAAVRTSEEWLYGAELVDGWTFRFTEAFGSN